MTHSCCPIDSLLSWLIAHKRIWIQQDRPPALLSLLVYLAGINWDDITPRIGGVETRVPNTHEGDYTL